MLYKKRWSDGLSQDFDYLNEFEAKVYCFGGDGGGNGGGASSEPKGTTFRGGKISGETKVNVPDAPPSRPSSNIIEQRNKQRTLDMVNRAAQDSLRSKQNIQPQALPAPPQNATSLGDIFGARVPNSLSQGAPEQNVPTFTPASFTTELPSVTSLPSTADMINMAPAMNVNTYSPPTQQNVNPLSVDLGPGTLTPTFDPRGQGVGLEFNMPFNTSSVSQQGIGSLDQSAVMEALTRGVNNPTPMPAGSVQTAGMFDNVFGTLTAPLEYVGNNLVRRGNTYTPRGSGGITSTRQEPSMFDQIAGTGKQLADQVGLGSVFD